MTFRDHDHGYLSSIAHEIRTDIKGVCRELEKIQKLTEYQSQRLPESYRRRPEEIMAGPPTRISDKTFEIIMGLVKMNEVLLHKVHELEDVVYGRRAPSIKYSAPPYTVTGHFHEGLPKEREDKVREQMQKLAYKQYMQAVAGGNIEQEQAVALGPDGKLRPATPAQETEQEPDVIKEAKRKLSE